MLYNGKELVDSAFAGQYAVAAFTIYNLEWARAVLTAAEDLKSPVMVSVSEASAEYMGGFGVASAMVHGLMESLHIHVPVALHLDHGSLGAAENCLLHGYSSVMYDGSHVPLEENLQNTRKLVEEAHKRHISVEAEVGAIAGDEDDNSVAQGEIADPDVCAALAATGIDYLAAGIGNIHGAYPPDWQGLNFDALEAIVEQIGPLPLVLHGGTGIPDEQIQRAISMGVAKINVNTECQIGFTAGLREYFDRRLDMQPRGHDPRKIMVQPIRNIYEVVWEKLHLFGSVGKA